MSEAEDIAREESNGHSIYGASKSSRFLECLGSLRAEFGLPDTAKYEAAEGTVAHGLAEEWLKTGERPAHRLGTIETVKLHTGTYEIPIDETMLAYAGQYVDWCNEPGGDHYYEQRVGYAQLTPIPDQGGTADHLALRPGALVLTDLKYGVADQIFAYRNPQVMLYALGAIYEWDWIYDIQQVTIRICQPRLGHFDVWHTTKAELLEFAEWAKGRMHAAWAPDAPRTPSEKACRYCKAKLHCPAAAAKLDRLLDGVFEDETFDGTESPQVWRRAAPATVPALVPAKTLDTASLAHLATYRKWAEKLLGEAWDELDRRIKGGEPIPKGFMLSEGKQSRSVADRDGVIELFDLVGANPLIEGFKSPAQLEETLVKEGGYKKKSAAEMLKPFISVRAGNPTLSLVKPGKRAVHDAAEDLFDDETAAEDWSDGL